LKKFACFFNFFNRTYCDCTAVAAIMLCAHIFDAY
jgi:hypothetical protein